MITKDRVKPVCISCYSCLNRNRCIRASSLSSQPRKFFLSYLGYHQEPNEAMLKGTLTHEKYFEMYQTIEQIGIVEFMKRVYAGEEVIVKELGICANGLRGHMDLVKINYKDNIFNIEVIELKPSYYKTYPLQLSAYAQIWNSYNMLIHYTLKTKRSEKVLTYPFYPKDKQFSVNITGKLIFYKTDKFRKMWLVKENVFVSNWYFATNYKIKKFRSLMKSGEHYLNEIPLCGNEVWCQSCSYRWLCKKYSYEPKSHQRKFGKRKVLIK